MSQEPNSGIFGNNTKNRITNLENRIFYDTDSLASKIAQLEVHQSNDNDRWEKLQTSNENAQKVAELAELISKIPGGVKTILVTLLLIHITVILVVDVAVRYLGIDQSIEMVKERLK
ncbi:MAG TPA: hypothetical protein VK203_27810 [Nostocaceae cyanobacterium]|nr:hypothetical protein [Nostocaceae cyanobacterium]